MNLHKFKPPAYRKVSSYVYPSFSEKEYETRHNLLPMVQSKVYARYYKRASLYPANVWEEKPAGSLKELQEVTQQQWEEMYERGIFVRPKGC